MTIAYNSYFSAGLSTGAITGIVIGVIIAIILVGALGFVLFKKKKGKKSKSLNRTQNHPIPERTPRSNENVTTTVQMEQREQQGYDNPVGPPVVDE